MTNEEKARAAIKAAGIKGPYKFRRINGAVTAIVLKRTVFTPGSGEKLVGINKTKTVEQITAEILAKWGSLKLLNKARGVTKND